MASLLAQACALLKKQAVLKEAAMIKQLLLKLLYMHYATRTECSSATN